MNFLNILIHFLETLVVQMLFAYRKPGVYRILHYLYFGTILSSMLNLDITNRVVALAFFSKKMLNFKFSQKNLFLSTKFWRRLLLKLFCRQGRKLLLPLFIVQEQIIPPYRNLYSSLSLWIF